MRFFRINGLTIVLLLIFAGSILQHLLAGWQVANSDAACHGQEIMTLSAYSPLLFQQKDRTTKPWDQT